MISTFEFHDQSNHQSIMSENKSWKIKQITSLTLLLGILPRGFQPKRESVKKRHLTQEVGGGGLRGQWGKAQSICAASGGSRICLLEEMPPGGRTVGECCAGKQANNRKPWLEAFPITALGSFSWCWYQAPSTLALLLLSRWVVSDIFAIPWTVAHQTPLCMGFLLHRNTEVGGHFLLQGIFPTQGLNPCLLHWQVDTTEPHGKPHIDTE